MWILVAMLLTLPNKVFAVNPYSLGQVVYFGETRQPEAQPTLLEWGTPHTEHSQNARTIPGPILSLLEDPSPANAKLFLEWQNERIKKIIKAQEAVEQALLDQGSKT